jgi:hypothetical protein
MIEGPPSALAWGVFAPLPAEVVPMNDIVPHVHGMTCWCNPEVDKDNVTVHHARDRRDDYIEGRRKPS